MFFWLIIFGMLGGNVGWWWWAARRMRPLRRAKLWRGALAAFMGLQLGCFVLVLALRIIGLRPMFPVTVMAGLYIWHLLVLPAVTGMLIFGAAVAGVVKGAIAFLRMLGRPRVVDDSADELLAAGPTRRQVLWAGVAAVPPMVTAGGVGRSLWEMNDFRVRRMTVTLPRLPSALDGLTIAHVTDVHAGRFTGRRQMELIARQTNALDADLVLMTGDLIDFSLADLPAAMEMVRGLRGRYGLFMCEGNHDLFEDRYVFEDRLIEAGIPLLLNQGATVKINGQAVQVLGLKWGVGMRGRDPMIGMHMSRLLERRDSSAFPILLAHHPHAFDPAAEAGIPLTLAGHTHGGQLMLNDQSGAGPMMFKYWSGLYQRGNSALVVSNGVGNWFPLRINAPAEIVHVTLRRA